MVREKIRVSTRTLQWKCVESRTDSKCLYYGRFILSPLMKGQADTIGIAIRRARFDRQRKQFANAVRDRYEGDPLCARRRRGPAKAGSKLRLY